MKFPAYLIRHPRKTLWLVHQYRQAYDLYDAGQTNLPAGKIGEDIRRVIKNADDECFRGARRIFAISDVTQQRLAKYNGFESSVLRAPINDPEIFIGGPADGYIFAGGRVNAAKRQHLLLEALALTPRQVRLVIAGPPDSAADSDRLREAVERLGLQDRVQLDLRYLDRSRVRQLHQSSIRGGIAAVRRRVFQLRGHGGRHGGEGLDQHDRQRWRAGPRQA